MTDTTVRRDPWYLRLPVVVDLRRSVGLQRGMLIAGLVLTALLLLTALFAPLLAPYSWAQTAVNGQSFGAQQPPSSAHLLGTTVSGYDVLSRVIWGTRTAVAVMFAAVILSLPLGVLLGLISGYIGGWLDRVLTMIADAIYAFPSLLLAIVMSIVISGGRSSALGGILSAALSITVVFIPQYFRVVRAEAVRLKAEPFVEAAQVIGSPTPRVMFRHVFRNSTRTLPLIFTLNASEAILTLAGLGFIGFGIEPTSASEWGYDLNRSISDVTSGIWWTALFPGLAIVLAVLGMTLVGESMNDLNDPRLRTRRPARKRPAPEQADATDPTQSAEIEALLAQAPEGIEVSEPRLQINDLAISFATDHGDVRAVDGVSLRIDKGEILALVGESGSGKTVTARSVLGLLPETATARGAILIEGHNVVGLTGSRLRQLRGQDVSMVFQEPSTALNPVFPVWWQIGEGLKAHDPKLTTKQIKARAVEALRIVGIPDPEKRINRYPHEFSGGQKQRIVIATALALGAELIVADEPTTALDVTVQAEILQLLRDVRDTYNTSILLITHNMGVVADLADSVAVMYQGRIIERAWSRELFRHPRETYTQNLLAAVPHLGRNSASAGLSSAEMDAIASAPVVVEAKGLEVEYAGRLGVPPFKAVRGVDLQIHEGEVFGLVGESGSGKTTIGRAMAGLEDVTGGTLTVLGRQVRGWSDRGFKPLRKEIGFVFQDPATSFNPQLTIGDAIAEPLEVHRGDLSASEQRRLVSDMLEAVELPADYAGRFPHELSGGQRQRVSFARALILQPKLLIADEPTSALDVSVQATVLELFKRLQSEFGFACLFISHDLAVVDMLAHRIGVLYKGELVEVGTGSNVLSHPRNDYTRRLIASLPVPDPDEQARRREQLRDLARASG